jgi:bifunctional UDP-N-acetylglucosamine pyrophosphorylase/glucosamine-1-phosphate N-acetyltransferase
LIAPVIIEDNCFIAAGTTVTKNINKGKFVIGRVKQTENDKLAVKYIGEKIDG